MPIGFHSVYQKCDATVAVMRLYRHFRQRGYEVDFLPRDAAPLPVHPEWDVRAMSNALLPFHQWIARRFDCVVWSEPVPTMDELRASRACTSRNVLLVEWEHFDQQRLDVYKAFDRLVCSSWLATTLLADKLKLKNAIYAPIDAGLPLTANSRAPTNGVIRLFWSLWGSQACRTTNAMVDIIDGVLRRNSHVQLTISYSAASLERQAERVFRLMKRACPGRLSLLKDDNFDKHLLEMGRHDLLVWPSLSESVGLCGLHALAMGVPVLAFDYPLTSEFLQDRKNALLVPCELSYNSLGVPAVDPKGYLVFGAKLEEAVQNPSLLVRLKRHVFAGLSDRQEVFSRAWESIIDG